MTLNTFQKVNKFEGMHALGNKINLFRELMKMLLHFEKSYFIFPLSWVYPLEDEKIQEALKYSNVDLIFKPTNKEQYESVIIKNWEDTELLDEEDGRSSIWLVQTKVQNGLTIDE